MSSRARDCGCACPGSLGLQRRSLREGVYPRSCVSSSDVFWTAWSVLRAMGAARSTTCSSACVAYSLCPALSSRSALRKVGRLYLCRCPVLRPLSRARCQTCFARCNSPAAVSLSPRSTHTSVAVTVPANTPAGSLYACSACCRERAVCKYVRSGHWRPWNRLHHRYGNRLPLSHISGQAADLRCFQTCVLPRLRTIG